MWSGDREHFHLPGARGSPAIVTSFDLLFTGSVSLSTDFTAWLGMCPFCSQSWYSEICVQAWHLCLTYASHSYDVLFMSVFACGTLKKKQNLWVIC